MRDCVVLASAASRKSVAVAKSVREVLGLRVVGVAHALHPHVFSRYFSRVHLAEVNRDAAEWAYAVLGVAREHRCRAVVPIDFADFYTLSKHRDLFEGLGVALAAPPHESVVAAADRVRCREALGDLARFPPHALVAGEGDAEKVHRLRPPLVVKNLGDSSNPAFHLDHGTALRDALSRAPALVEEYVEGVARGYYALAFEGAPLLEFTHQRVVEYAPIGGPSLWARGAVGDPALVALGRAILKRLRWSGVIMVETRYSDEEGAHYVLELNPKFWGSVDLPESLGYRFAALLVALHLYGYEGALELKRGLSVRSGSFVWLLDALRYLPKLPSVWAALARAALSGPARSDVDPADAARGLAQALAALRRLGRERRAWEQYLKDSSGQLRAWLRRFARFLASPRRVVVLDFDATIVRLPVEWARVREELVSAGLLRPWESINRALARLWASDRGLYWQLSEAVKRHELEALGGLRALVAPEALRALREHSRVCVATKQPAEVALRALEALGAADAVEAVVGRDSGLGPQKAALFRGCVDACGGGEAVVVDDGLEYVVAAYRMGYAPMLASPNPYLVARAYRLGLPAGEPKALVDALVGALRAGGA